MEGVVLVRVDSQRVNGQGGVGGGQGGGEFIVL